MKIIWTEKALTSFEEIINYLINKFGSNTTLKFYEETMSIIESIDKNNDIGKRIDNSIYRQFIIAKKTSMIYSFNDLQHFRVDEVYLHYFWDNRGNSKRLRKMLGL